MGSTVSTPTPRDPEVPPPGESPPAVPRLSGTFALLGLAARSPRVSETASAPPPAHDGLAIRRKNDAPANRSAVSAASSAASSPGDRATEGELFLRTWETDRIQTRDRLHERLY